LRTLWIKPGGFLPLDAGGKIRSYHTVRNLASKWPTTVLTFYPAVENDQNPLLGKEVDKLITIPLRHRLGRATEAMDYATAVLTSKPYMFQKFCRPEVTRAVREEIQRTTYDLVICDFLLACGVMPFEIDVPKVVFTHNVECRIWERHHKVATNSFRRWMARREWKRLEEMERYYLSKADLVLAVSPSDRDQFVSWGLQEKSVVSVPTGVDTDFFAPRPSDPGPPRLVFTGSMDWMPNQDGILFFLEKIFPLIENGVPDVRLDIVGRKPPAAIIQAAGRFKGVTVTGWVEDVRSYLAQADVCIVPLRVGSGTRLKIFEAMAMAKATVSTTIGAEGLPVTDQQDIMIADTPEEFSARTIELLLEPEKRLRLGSAARKLVEHNFSWSAVTRVLMEKIQTGIAGMPKEAASKVE
jgi:glycosyltransferase involved in cell wall biosynthesis